LLTLMIAPPPGALGRPPGGDCSGRPKDRLRQRGDPFCASGVTTMKMDGDTCRREAALMFCEFGLARGPAGAGVV
jgi:hypothetical protein